LITGLSPKFADFRRDEGAGNLFKEKVSMLFFLREVLKSGSVFIGKYEKDHLVSCGSNRRGLRFPGRGNPLRVQLWPSFTSFTGSGGCGSSSRLSSSGPGLQRSSL
jgi:hypothetical protein